MSTVQKRKVIFNPQNHQGGENKVLKLSQRLGSLPEPPKQLSGIPTIP
jgi:hypothetical protein